jgi:hypothetical protein
MVQVLVKGGEEDKKEAKKKTCLPKNQEIENLPIMATKQRKV